MAKVTSVACLAFKGPYDGLPSLFRQVAIVGLADEEWGEVVAAAIVASRESSLEVPLSTRYGTYRPDAGLGFQANLLQLVKLIHLCSGVGWRSSPLANCHLRYRADLTHLFVCAICIEQICHISDSEDQIMALGFRQVSSILKSCFLFARRWIAIVASRESSLEVPLWHM